MSVRDILDQLRDPKCKFSREQVADEIERLRAERDALRGELKDALVRQEYFDEEVEVAEGRIWEEITTADATIIDLRAKLDALRAVLAFYADPPSDEQVPDFYGELDFGSRARAALKDDQS